MVTPAGSRTVTASVFAKASELDLEHLKQRLPAIKKHLIRTVANDCRNFAEIMKDWRDNNLWRHFSDSWETFIVDHLEKPSEWVDHMILGWEMLDHNQPIPARTALAASRRANAIAVSGVTKVDTTKHSGTDPQYLASRIAKESPEVHQRLQQGEFRSIRAAAIEAGVLEPRKQLTISRKSDPDKLARSLVEYDPTMARAIMEALQDALG